MIFPDPISISLGISAVSQVYMGDVLVWPYGIPMAINYERTSIYGLSSDVNTWAADNGVAAPILTWQISSATTNEFVDVPSLSSFTAYLSGTTSGVNLASILPINARLKAQAGSSTFISTNNVYLKPYETPTDIPKLQFWMDMSDPTTISTAPILTQDWCWKFAKNNYITIANPNTFGYSKYDFKVQDFTIESWIYITNNNQNNIIFTNEESSAERSLVFYVSLNNNLVASFSETGSSYFLTLSSSALIQPKQWTHVAVTRNNNIFRIFVNGNETAGSTVDLDLNRIAHHRPNNWYVGARPWNLQYFDGFISNFRLNLQSCLYSSDFSLALPTIPLLYAPSSIYLFTNNYYLQNWSDLADILSLEGPAGPQPVNPNLGLVEFITDKTTSGFVASQSDSTSKGVYLSGESGINGLNVLHFDGSNTFYTLNKNLSVNTITNPQSAFTHFFVYERSKTGISNTSLGVNNLTADSLFLHSTDDSIYSSLRKTGTITSLTSVEIAGIVRNTFAVTDQVNNTFTTAWGTSSTKNNYANQLGRYQTSVYNSGSIGEIFHANIALPLNEVRLVNKVLEAKWLGTITTPILINPPFVSVVTTNSTLSSTAGNWSQQPILQIQWQKSFDGNVFQDIDGETNSVYTPTITDADLYIRTAVIGTNPKGVTGPVYSNALRLTAYRNSELQIAQIKEFNVYLTNHLDWTSTLPITSYSFDWQINGDSTGNQWQTVFGTNLANQPSWDFTPYDYSSFPPTNTNQVSIVQTSIFGISAIAGTWSSALSWPIDLTYQWQIDQGSGWQTNLDLGSTSFAYLSENFTGGNIRVIETAFYRQPLLLDSNQHYIRVGVKANTRAGSFTSFYNSISTSNELYLNSELNTNFSVLPLIIENEQRDV